MRLNYFFGYKKATLKYVGVVENNVKRGDTNDEF
ncbi:hypothetical protein N752_25150 [Desulforamulus aquiferis]|nr:hypothetical protein N752_25150 [Desulforamulus aquiferis]